MATFGGPADWWTDGTDAGRTHIATKGIVQDGLVLNLDAGVDSSYPNSGITWKDLSGTGNNGTLINGPTFNSGNGGSIVFDGVNDYARINNFNDDSNLAFSVFCWVYPTDLTLGSSGGNFLNWIINKRNTATPNSNSWQFLTVNSYLVAQMWDSNDNLIVVNGTGAEIASNSLSTLQENKWFYVGFTTNGINNGYLNIYQNNILNYSGTLSGNRGIATKTMDIGKAGWTFNFYWKGGITQIQIYNRALTPTEITQNYNATKGRFGL